LAAWSFGGAGFVGWSAIFWFALSLVAWRAHALGITWGLAAVALGCAGFGIYAFATGWPYFLTDYPPGPAAWVWLAAFALMLAAATVRWLDRSVASKK